MRNINLELKIWNLKFQVLDIQVYFPSQQFSKQKDYKTLQFLYTTKSKAVELNCSKSSHQRCSVKKGVLRNFAKFTGKYLCQSLFFNKVARAACNFIKKETVAQVFSCKFSEISKNTFLTEHLRRTASVAPQKHQKTTYFGCFQGA